jgi:uncharacterized protein
MRRVPRELEAIQPAATVLVMSKMDFLCKHGALPELSGSHFSRSRACHRWVVIVFTGISFSLNPQLQGSLEVCIKYAYHSMDITYDRTKRLTHLLKHKIDFVDIDLAFFTHAYALTIEDRDHAEQRFVTLASDGRGRILVVVYVCQGDSMRIISARRAESFERKQYEEKR